MQLEAETKAWFVDRRSPTFEGQRGRRGCLSLHGRARKGARGEFARRELSGATDESLEPVEQLLKVSGALAQQGDPMKFETILYEVERGRVRITLIASMASRQR